MEIMQAVRVGALMRLLEYKKWADQLSCDALKAIGHEEAFKSRMTTFGSIIRTQCHVYAVDDIFKHHLTRMKHGYQSRNIENTPSIEQLCSDIAEMNHWYLEHVRSWHDYDLDEVVHFQFLDGQKAALTKENIILHIVNHATYHRGFIGDMMKQIPYHWPSNDFTVFLSHEGSAVL